MTDREQPEARRGRSDYLIFYTIGTFTTYGGMGDEFLKKRWRPFFKELMAEELKAGGLGWKTRKRQQRALEKLSIVLARENGAMIARATSWQQAVATRP